MYNIQIACLSKIDYDAVNKEWEQQQADDSNKEQLSQQNTDNVIKRDGFLCHNILM